MKLLADENFDRPLVIELRNRGHSIISIAEDFSGSSDLEVYQLAKEQAAPILTEDKDFGELCFKKGLNGIGICLVRFSTLSQEAMRQRFLDLFEDCYHFLKENFIVLSPSGIRLRKLS